MGSWLSGSPVSDDFLTGEVGLVLQKLSWGMHETTRQVVGKWWARWDLNPRPKDYESSALTAELQARFDEKC